jgi:hypothetical protein
MSADVVEWEPDGPDPELERRLPIVAAAYGDVGQRAGHAEALRAVNRALARAGLVALESAELAADLDEVARRRELELRVRARDEPWEVVEGPPIAPEPRDDAAERARIVETAVYRHAEWWGREGRRYPLPNGASAGEHARAEADRRQLLADANRELRALDLEPVGLAELVTVMARLHRPIGLPGDVGLPPAPGAGPLDVRPAAPARDGSGRFVRGGKRLVGRSISRTSREGR